MCIATWHKKTLQLTLMARHTKTRKSGVSHLRFRNMTLLYHYGNADFDQFDLCSGQNRYFLSTTPDHGNKVG